MKKQSPQTDKQPATLLSVWHKQRKFQVQSLALLLAFGGSFGLFLALNVQATVISATLFCVVVLSMALTIWIS